MATSDGSERVSGVSTELRDLAERFNDAFYREGETTWTTTRWLGVRTMRYPSDLIVLGEIVAETRPELVIESGVFEGGGSLFVASVLDGLGAGRVLGVDIDLSRVVERTRSHPRVELIESSSTDPKALARISAAASGLRTMVILDSDHSTAHVLDELRALAPLVTPGCYLIVEDTAVNGRPVHPAYGPGPAEALAAWLDETQPFTVDRSRERFGLTTNPGGYLRRVDGDPAVPRGPLRGRGLPAAIRDAAPPAERPAPPPRGELASLRHAVRTLAEHDDPDPTDPARARAAPARPCVAQQALGADSSPGRRAVA